MAQAEFRSDGVIDDVAVGVDGAFEGDGVGVRVVAEHFQQTGCSASGVPVEVTGAGGGVTIRPKAPFTHGAVAGIMIVDGSFIDLGGVGLEEFGADGLADGAEVPGGGVVPGVEGLAADVDVVPSSETLGLAVVGKVILVFVGDDLGSERGG